MALSRRVTKTVGSGHEKVDSKTAFYCTVGLVDTSDGKRLHNVNDNGSTMLNRTGYYISNPKRTDVEWNQEFTFNLSRLSQLHSRVRNPDDVVDTKPRYHHGSLPNETAIEVQLFHEPEVHHAIDIGKCVIPVDYVDAHTSRGRAGPTEDMWLSVLDKHGIPLSTEIRVKFSLEWR